MKAAVRSKYGSSEALKVTEIETPTPKDNELLIRVYATTVSRTDCHVLTGKPFFMKFFTGLFKPNFTVTGTDFAGQIEAIGRNVKSFNVGDKVIGFEFLGLRSHAQYLTIPDTKGISMMPDNTTYSEAAACIEGAFYALNAIKAADLKQGQKALVYGATGAIGSSAVQFLKFYGIYVTAVCGSENSELIKSLGADKIIDYKSSDFTKDNEQYDYVLDAVGKSTFEKCKPLLKEKGVYSSSGGGDLFAALITPLLGGKKVLFSPPKNLKGCLTFIKDLVEKGSFRPVVDKTYPLDKIAEAFNYVLTGEKIGNVIITMDGQP